jgi:hypothetical protein
MIRFVQKVTIPPVVPRFTPCKHIQHEDCGSVEIVYQCLNALEKILLLANATLAAPSLYEKMVIVMYELISHLFAIVYVDGSTCVAYVSIPFFPMF